MHRIDSAYREVDKFGAGKDGYTEGDPPTTAATRPTDDHFNAFQEELCGLVENQKGALVKADNTQVETAIKNMFARNAMADWSEQTNPKNFALHGIAYYNGRYVAVGLADGVDAYIVTSNDEGVTWTERANPKNFNLYGVAHDGVGLWTAVGANDGVDSYIVTSADNGVTWIERAPAVAKAVDLRSVAHDGVGLWTAVGNHIDGSAYIVTSTDGGVADPWTRRVPTIAKAVLLSDVAHDGSGLWAAVGVADGVDGYIVTSTDGGIADPWTERANPKNFSLYSVAHDGSGLWVACGINDGVDVYLIRSTDGLTWAESTNPGTGQCREMTHNGRVWVMSDSGGPRIIASSDGITWAVCADTEKLVRSMAHGPFRRGVGVGDADGVDAYIITSLKTPF